MNREEMQGGRVNRLPPLQSAFLGESDQIRWIKENAYANSGESFSSELVQSPILQKEIIWIQTRTT